MNKAPHTPMPSNIASPKTGSIHGNIIPPFYQQPTAFPFACRRTTNDTNPGLVDDPLQAADHIRRLWSKAAKQQVGDDWANTVVFGPVPTGHLCRILV
jgi:hypothetical protein